MENEQNASEDESVLASIDESSTDDDYNYGSISTKALEFIQDENHAHPDIKERDSR